MKQVQLGSDARAPLGWQVPTVFVDGASAKSVVLSRWRIQHKVPGFVPARIEGSRGLF